MNVGGRTIWATVHSLLARISYPSWAGLINNPHCPVLGECPMHTELGLRAFSEPDKDSRVRCFSISIACASRRKLKATSRETQRAAMNFTCAEFTFLFISPCILQQFEVIKHPRHSTTHHTIPPDNPTTPHSMPPTQPFSNPPPNHINSCPHLTSRHCDSI